MKKLAWMLPVLAVLAACGGGPPVGYLNTDVLEPRGLSKDSAQGVKVQGSIFQEGTLSYSGSGDLQRLFMGYIEDMREAGWTPASNDMPDASRSTGTLRKDTRTLTLEATSANGAIKMIIRVSSGAPPK